jgi:hypothetical protein
MTIFSRRVIQRLVDENAAFLTQEQLDKHVAKLNRDDFRSLDTEWEVAVLNAFSKLGLVVHEPKLPGTSLIDLLFSTADRSTFLADIKAVTDEGIEDENPVKAFDIELRQRLKNAGLIDKGWILDIGEIPRAFGEQRKPAIPPRGEFHKEIFNPKFKQFLKSIKDQPDKSHTYKIRTAKTAIVLTYDPKRTGFMGHLPVYTQALTKEDNSVYRGLRNKARQLKKAKYECSKGIILCDGGSDMFFAQPHGSFEFGHNVVDAVRDFLRQNQSIQFVLIISSIWKKSGQHGPLPGEHPWKIQVMIVPNKDFGQLSSQIKKSLEDLEDCFPEPINTASGAMETIRNRIKQRVFRPLAGGIEVSNDRISISASGVLGVLAGRITERELFRDHGSNPFEQMLNKRLVSIQVEEDQAEDDDTLVFEFGGFDPATSRYRSPKSRRAGHE